MVEGCCHFGLVESLGGRCASWLGLGFQGGDLAVVSVLLKTRKAHWWGGVGRRWRSVDGAAGEIGDIVTWPQV